MKDPDRKSNSYKESQNSARDKSDRVRRIRNTTLTIFLLEFVAIAVGILVAGLTSNFICLGVTVGIFILTVILGANEKTLRCIFVKIKIKSSKNKIQAAANIIDDKIIEATTVNGELTKVIMEFKLKIDGKRYTGYKILKVKKLRKGKDFKDDETYENRLTSFKNDLKENGARLNVLYMPDRKYCYISDNTDYVFNYFITDVLYAEDKAKKFS